MTDRPTVNTINSDQLDRLHTELDDLRERFAGQAVAGAELCDHLRSAEAAIARVQALADEHPAGIDTALIHAALDEPAPVSSPLRDQITTAVRSVLYQDLAGDMGEHVADAVLAVLPATADRAAVLRELADQQEATAATDVIRRRRSIATARRLFAVELRRMADEPQPAPPYSPTLEARVEERRPDGSWRTWTIRDDPDRARREYDRQTGEQADRAWRLLHGRTTWTTVAEHKPESS